MKMKNFSYLYLLILSFIYKAFGYIGSYNKTIPFSERCLYAHNYIRKRHNLNNLQWSNVLSRQSFLQARTMAHKNNMEYSTGAIKKIYGENIFKGYTGFKEPKSISEAVYHWYDFKLLGKICLY